MSADYASRRGQQRKGERLFTAVRSAILGCAFIAPGAFAQADLPTGEQVQHGSADFVRDSNSLTVDQHTGSLVVNWDDFSIAAGNKVNFLQNVTDIALNRVVGDNPSHIYGDINAGGQVFLINQSGILFSPTSRVDAAGLVASTLDISDEDFLSGNYDFAGTGGSVINQGTINVADGGYVALLGQEAINSGIIAARMGTVAIGAGERVTFDLNGDGLVNFHVEKAAVDALVANHGMVYAEGGLVYMTAKAAGDLAATVVNNDGVIEATSIEERDGKVFLVAEGGDIASSGSIDVAGTGAADGGAVTLDTDGTTIVSGNISAGSGADGGVGGSVKVLGDHVGLAAGADIDASGVNGGGDVLVGGAFQGNDADVRNASRTFVAGDASISADALVSGDGGTVIVWADEITRYYGHISAVGGAASGNGGFVEVSGKDNLGFWGTVDLSAPLGALGTLLLDPNNITIVDAAPAADDGEITDPADNEILFGDGGAADFTISNDLLDATTADVTLQANIDILVNAEVNMTPSLTLQAGQDITFNSAVTTGGSLTAQADRDIFVNANLTTTGDLILNADRDGSLDGSINLAGAALSSNGGNIVLGGGSDPTAEYAYGRVSGETRGIWIDGTSSLDSAGGNILLHGASGSNGAGGAFYGISLEGSIDSGTGTVLIDGISQGQGGDNAQGFEMSGSITSANTTASAISITGEVIPLAANTFTAMGVNIAGSITTTAGGSISVTGTGAATAVNQFSDGVLVQGAANVDSGSGDITIDGTSTSRSGVNFTGGLVTGNGTTTITGDTSATGTSDALSVAGVRFSGAGTRLSTATGDIVVDGNTTGGDYSQGIRVDGARVETTGSGTVTFNGTHGSPSTLSTWAMGLVNGGIVRSTAVGGGDLTFNTNSADYGLVLDASQITSNGGAIAINDQSIRGVYLDAASSVDAGSTGSIDLALDSDLTFVDAASTFASTGGTLQIRPFTASGTIGVGLAGFDIDLAASLFSTHFVDGFSLITIGDASTGVVRVGALGLTDINDALLFRTGSNLFFDGVVDIDENISAFTGDSVVVGQTIDTTGAVDFQASNGVQVSANITASGDLSVAGDADLSGEGGVVPDNIGTVDFSGGGALSGANVSVASGGALALGNVTATGTLDISTSADAITQNGGTVLSATAGATSIDVGAGADVTLTNSNDFSSVSLTGAGANTVQVTDGNALAIGGDAATLTADAGGALDFTGGTYTTLNGTAGGNITQSGALSVSGATTLTSDAAAITASLNDGANEFNSVTLASAGGSFTSLILRDADTDLDGLTVGGDSGTLTVTSAGDLTLAGGSYTTMNLVPSGSVSQSSAVSVSGTATILSPGGTTTVALTDAANELNDVDLTGPGTFTSVSLVDADTATDGLQVAGDAVLLTAETAGALDFAGGTYTTLNATAGGNITDSGALTVSGTTTLTAADASAITATLDIGTNDFNTVVVGAAGTGNMNGAFVADANAMTIGGTADGLSAVAVDLTLSAGTYTSLNATASNSIVDSGVLNVSGTTQLISTAADVTAVLDDAHELTTVSLNTGSGTFSTVTVNDDDTVGTNGLTVGGNATTLTAITGGALDLAGGTYTTLNGTAGGNIAQSGALSVSGITTLTADTNAITADLSTQPTNDFGSVALATVNGGSFTSASIVDANALSVGGDAGTLTADVGGALDLAGGTYTTLNAQSDSGITQSGGLNVSGTTTLTADVVNMTADLATQANSFGTVTLVDGAGDFGDVNVSGTGGYIFGGDAADVTLLFGGQLTLAGGSYGILFGAAGGNVIQTGAVSVTGAATFASTGVDLDITLEEALNDFGSFVLNSGSFDAVSVVDANALTIGGDANSLTASTGTGGALVFAGGTYTTLNGAAGADISQTGALTVSGTTTLTSNGAGPIAANFASSTNNFGTVTLVDGTNTFGTVSLRDSDGIILGGGNAGVLNVTAAGDIAQSGALTTNVTTLTSTDGVTPINVDLSTSVNAMSTLQLANGGGNFGAVSYRDADGIILNGNGTGMTSLDVTAGGNISQSGNVSVSGAATFTADTNAITLGMGSIGNEFGSVTLASANFGSFTSADIFDPNNVTVSGDAGTLSAVAGTSLTLGGGVYNTLNATIRSGSTLDQTGAVTVTGATTVTSDLSTVSVDLSDGANDFNTVTFNSLNGGTYTDISVSDDNALSVGNANVAGDITLAADGNLTITGTVQTSAAGDISLNADADAAGAGLLTLAVGSTVNSAGDLTLTGADFEFDLAPANLVAGGIFDLLFTQAGDLCLGSAAGAGGCVINLDATDLSVLTTVTGDLELDNTGSAIRADAADFGGINLSLIGTTISDELLGNGLDNIDNLTLTAENGIGSGGGLNVDATTVTATNTTSGDISLIGDGAGSTTYTITGGPTDDVTVSQSVGDLVVSSIDATGAVTLAANPGKVDVDGDITTEGAVDLTGAAGIDLGATITTNGNVDFNSPVVLTANSLVDATASPGTPLITFANTVDGGFELDVRTSNLAGVVSFNDVVGGTAPLAALQVLTNAASFAGDVTTTGSQNVNADAAATTNGTHTTSGSTINFLAGGLSLGADTVLDTGAGAGNINISGSLNGGQNLTLTAGTGDIDISTAVGDVVPLQSLTVNSATTATFGGDVTTVGAQAITADTIQTNGTHATTDSAISLTGDVILEAATALNTGANGGDITVTGSVDSDAGNSWALDLTAGTGNIDLQSAVGATDALASLTVNSATTARFGGDVTTDGVQAVTAGTIQTNGTHATTDSAISLTGNVILEAATALNTGANGGDITVTGSVDSDAGNSWALDLTAGTGNIDLQSAVGATDALASLTVNSATVATFGADVTTDGFQAVTAGTINTNGTHATTDSAISLTGDVILEAATALNTGANGGDITVTGSVDSDAGNSWALDLTAGTGNIDLQSAVGATDALASLTVNSATTARFGGDVTTDGVQAVTAGTIQTNGTHATTDSAISLTGDVILEAATALNTGANGGDITVTGSVDSDAGNSWALDLTAGTGNIDLQSAVGATDALASLTVNSATTARFGGDVTTDGTQDVTAGTIQTNGTHATTDSAISLTGAVALQSATALNSGANAGDITVIGDVDGAQTLAITAGTGNVDVQGTVGGGAPLTSLTINSAADTNLDAVTAGTITQVAGTGVTTLDGVLTSTTGDINITSDQIVQNAAITSFAEVLLEATQDIALNTGAVTAGSRLIHLIAGSGVLQDAANHGGLSADDLLLEGGGDFILVTDAANNLISNVATVGTVAGTVRFENDDALGLTVATVNDATATPNSGVVANAVEISTSVGNLTVDQPTQATAGDLLLESQAGGITIRQAVTGSADVSVKAFAGVAQATADGDISAGADLYVASTNGGTLNMVDGATSSAADTLVYEVVSGNGDLLLGGLSATTVLVTGVDDIVDNGDTDVDITATDVVLDSNSIGQVDMVAAADDAIETTIGTLHFTALSGSAAVSDSGTLVLADVSVPAYQVLNFAAAPTTVGATGYSGGSTANIHAVIQAATALTVEDGLVASNNILLSAANGDLAINNAVTSTGGSVELAASDNVTQAADGDVTASGGTLRVSAGTGDITMTDGAVGSASGNVAYAAANDVTVASISGANVSVNAGGDILDGSDAATDILATNVNLQAGGDIGETSDALDTSVSTLAASATSGGIYINESDGLIVDDVAAFNVNQIGLDGGNTPTPATTGLAGTSAGTNVVFDVSGAGDLTIGHQILNLEGNVLLRTFDGTLTINDQILSFTSAANGHVSVVAGDDDGSGDNGVFQGANGNILAEGSIDVYSDNGITMADDAVAQAAGTSAGANAGHLSYQTAAGAFDITVGQLNANQVYVNAGQDILDGGDTDRDIFGGGPGSGVILEAGRDIGENANPLETTMLLFSASATDGGVYISESDGVVVDTITAFDINRIGLDGAIGSTLSSGSLAGTTAGTNVIIDVTGAGSLSVNSGHSITTDDGNILLQTFDGGISLGGLLDANTTGANGHVSILLGDDGGSADHTFNQGPDGDITADGSVDVYSANAISMADGAVTTSTGTSTNVNAGNIAYQTASGAFDIALGQLNGSDVLVNAGGSIIDNGDANTDIVADNLQLEAGTNIGQADGIGNGLIDIEAVTLAADAGGDIFVDEVTDALIIDIVGVIGVERVATDATTATQSSTAFLVDAANAGSDLFVRTAGGLTVNGSVSATDQLLLDVQGGDLALNNTVTAGGNASLLASGAIDQNAGADVVVGGTLDVDAQGGAITMADGTASTVTGNVHYLASGDILLSSLSGDNVLVNAGGSIIDNGDSAVDVIATNNAQLIAGNAIGEPVSTNNGLVETSVGVLAAEASNGGVFIDETDAVELGSVTGFTVQRVIIDSTLSAQTSALLEGVLASADVVVRANTNLTVSNAVEATAGNLLLRAETGNLQIDSTVDAGNDLTLQAVAGTISQSAGGDVSAGRDLWVQAIGDISMADGAVSTAVGNGKFLTVGDLFVGSIDVANVMIDITGNVVDNGDAGVDIVAADAIIRAAEIGQPTSAGNGPLETSLDFLVAQGNNVYISETDALNLGDSAVALNVQVNSVDLDAASVLDPGIALSVNQTAQNFMVESLTGSINTQTIVQAINGDLLLDAATDLLIDNTVTANAGNVSLIAGGAITQADIGDVSAGGSLDVDAGTTITMDDSGADSATATATGNIRYLAGGDIRLGGLDGADVRVESTGGSIIDNGDSATDITAINLQLVANGSIGEADGTNNGPLDVDVDTLAALATNGNLYLSETDGLELVTVADFNINRVEIDGVAAVTAVGALSNVQAASNLKIEVLANDLTVTDTVTATAADLLLDAAGNLQVDNTVTATAGNASLLAGGAIGQSATGDVTVGGTLDVFAQGGDITMTDGAISLATGNIRYEATGDIRLASLSGADVEVRAGASIIDNGETDVDVIATNAMLIAGSGLNNSIGELTGTNNGPIETTVDVIAAEALQGNVYLFETDDLEIGFVAPISVNRIGIDSSATILPASQLAGIQAALEIDVEADDILIANEVRSLGGNILLRARDGGIDQTGATLADPALNQVIALAGDITMLADNGNILLQRVSADGNTVTLTASGQILNDNLGVDLAGEVNVIADTLIASADDTIGLTAAGQFTDPSNEQRLITEVENDIQVFLAQAGTVGIDNTSTDGEVDVVFNLPLADVSNGSSVWVRTSEAMRALGLEFATESNAVEFNGNVQLLAVDGDLTLNEAQVGDANDVNLVAQWMRLSAPRGAFLNGDGSRFLNVGDGLVLTADDLVIVTGGDLGVEATVDRIDITGTGLYQVAPGGTPGTGGENADLNIQLSKRDIAVVDDPILFESIIITRPASDGVPTWITDLDAFYPYVFDENNYGLFSTGTASAISLRQDDGVNTTHDGSINFPSNVNVGALSSALDLTLEVRAGQFNTTEYAGTVYVLPGVNVLAENIGTPDTGTLSAFGNVLVDGNVIAREDRSIEAQGRGGDIIIDSDTSAAGRVVLSPGQGFDVIFTNAATFRVSQGVSAEGDLVILSARNVLMDPDTAILADGSVLIGADNITGSVVEATGIDAVEGDIVLYDVTANANGNGIGDIVVYTNGGRSGETYTFDGPAGPTTYTVTGSITLGRQDVLDDLLANLALDPNFLDAPANVPVPALQAVNVKLFAHDSIDSGWSVDYAAGDLTPDQELTHVVADKTMVLYALNGTVGGTSQIALDANLAPAQQALRVDVGDLMSIGAGSLDVYGVSAHLVGNAQRLQELLYVPGLIVFNKWAVGGAIQPKFVSGTSIDAINYQMLDFAPLSVSTQQALLVNAHGTHNAVWDANMEAGQPMPVQAMWIAEGGGISGGVNVLLDPAVVGDNWTFRSYAVVSGDTLWDIAEKYLGDPLRWPEIWWLTEGISDPDVIEPGQEIHLEAEDIRRLKALQAEEEEAAAKAEAEARAAAEAEGVAL